MNLGKTVLKMELAQHWARQMEDIERSIDRDLWRMDGGADALRHSAAALDQHRSYWQAKCDAGELTMAETKLAMTVIDKCIGGLQSLLDKATLAKQLKTGELAGLRRGISMLERDFKAESEKVRAVEGMIEHDGRPHLAVADDIARRKLEARAEKEAMAAKKKATKKATKKSTAKKSTAKSDGCRTGKTKKKTK